jgi:hypothetical protein
VIAFDEHDGWSIRAERAACNIIIAQLETTHYTHNKPDSMGLLFKNPIRMGEDESHQEQGNGPLERESLKSRRASVFQANMPMCQATHRVISHLDTDAFYSSIEQRDNTALRSKPVIVGAPPAQLGVGCAVSYEPRKFGVPGYAQRRGGPPLPERRLCPVAHGGLQGRNAADHEARRCNRGGDRADVH